MLVWGHTPCSCFEEQPVISHGTTQSLQEKQNRVHAETCTHVSTSSLMGQSPKQQTTQMPTT